MTRFLAAAMVVVGLAGSALAQSPEPVSFGPYDQLVPRHLLGLVHAPEVHEELGLTEAQVAELEGLFGEIDGLWFRSRLLPPAKQTPILAGLEARVWVWLDANAKPQQRQRLQQLEYFAQANRMFLRDDAAERVGLPDAARASLARAAERSIRAQVELSQAAGDDDRRAELQDAAEKAAKTERDKVKKLLTPERRQKLAEMLGDPFDVGKLKRIYPMAPEFAPVDNWINSEPVTLASLRGKVVLVHFYAFQCHNCHANFGIYQRWHNRLTERGVVVVGIQTPETSRERDPGAVREAAASRGLEFPILVDLKSQNWKNWGNTMWPTVYVVDKRGYLRQWWQGELNWQGATGDQVIESLIDDLLQES